MADAFTPNYNLVLPSVGGDADTWGTLLNENFSSIDTILATMLPTNASKNVTGQLKIVANPPVMSLRDTAETLPQGLFGVRVTGNALQFIRNTAAAGDFSTGTIPLSFDGGSDNASFLGSIVSQGTIDSAQGFVVSGSSGLASQVTLQLLNTHGLMYFYQDTSGNVGLYDNVAAYARWTTDTSGNMVVHGNISAFSDEKLKTDWRALPTDFIDALADVRHGTFTRTDTDTRQVGVSAQSLAEVLPEAVFDHNGTLSVAYGHAALAAAVQLAGAVVELRAEVAALKEKLA